jgi:AcrR family transcriptional regulator
MATPAKRLTYEERDRLILAKSEELFSRCGFDGTTTKAIAQAAKINEALIFKHCTSKEDLYEKVLTAKIKYKEERLAKIAPRLQSAKKTAIADDLFALATFMVNENRADPHCLRMMTFAALENHRLGRKFFKKRLPMVELTESYFHKHFKGKRSGRSSYRTTSRLFLSLVSHYVLITQIFRATDFYTASESVVLREIADTFAKGALA